MATLVIDAHTGQQRWTRVESRKSSPIAQKGPKQGRRKKRMQKPSSLRKSYNPGASLTEEELRTAKAVIYRSDVLVFQIRPKPQSNSVGKQKFGGRAEETEDKKKEASEENLETKPSRGSRQS
ncbi:hypothetical protein CAEBREN_21954 [Caenorhabditis brenneri]|uniref:Uncharacterized protein n=1 Tax=Caenorhabditis brenneri TaxID=135651 RepID=G0MQK7_CAEBE|nr:hypothetical protein CAEBREN_21954 [Caenorhabditis brenneri]